MVFKDISVFSSGRHLVLAECNPLVNFGRGLYEEDLHEIILNLGQHFRRCGLNIFFYFSSGGHIVWGNRTVWAI